MPSLSFPAEAAGEVDRGEADGARGHPVRGGAEEQAQVAMQQPPKKSCFDYFQNDSASKIHENSSSIVLAVANRVLGLQRHQVNFLSYPKKETNVN